VEHSQQFSKHTLDYIGGTSMDLVTGATGHIGNVLVRRLVDDGAKVRTLVLPNEDLTPLEGLPVEIVVGDILDPDSLQPAFKDIQTAYHLAGMISIMPGANEYVRHVNLEGTLNVLQAAHQAGINRLVYTSSIHALSRIPHGTTIDEQIPFDSEHAISAYDQSKAAASIAVQEAMQSGLNAVIICPTGVIGPYDFRRSEMGQLIIDAMRSGPQLYVEGAYDFVDVRDVADGLVSAARRGRRGESYILSGEQIKIDWLISTVQRLAGMRAVMIKVPMSLAILSTRFAPTYYRLARTRPRFTRYALETVTSNSVISSDKARRELNYLPRSLSESLRDTVQWFRENNANPATT
jgi:dihydroflavonol-4-reductase